MFYNLLLIEEKFLHGCSIHRQATSSGIEIDTISKIDPPYEKIICVLLGKL